MRDPISSRSIEHTILFYEHWTINRYYIQKMGASFIHSFIQVSIWCIWHGINWKYSNGPFFWLSAGPSCHTSWLYSINHFSELSKYLCSFSRIQMQQSHLKWCLFHKLCYLYRNLQRKNKADTLQNHMVPFPIKGEINTLRYKTLVYALDTARVLIPNVNRDNVKRHHQVARTFCLLLLSEWVSCVT